MAFFRDIIRDSRRRSVAFTRTQPTGMPASVDLGEAVPMPHAHPTGEKAFPLPGADVAGRHDVPRTETDLSALPFREEGTGFDGRRGSNPLPDGFGTRQVVGTLPAEHTAQAKPQRTTIQGYAPSNSVTREQAGRASGRTVTGDIRIGGTGSFHDGASNDPQVVGANDASAREFSSDRVASSAGKVSVETQERRQAGVMSRAGSTAPPEPPMSREVIPSRPDDADADAPSHLPAEEPGETPPLAAGTLDSSAAPRSRVSMEVIQAPSPVEDIAYDTRRVVGTSRSSEGPSRVGPVEGWQAPHRAAPESSGVLSRRANGDDALMETTEAAVGAVPLREPGVAAFEAHVLPRPLPDPHPIARDVIDRKDARPPAAPASEPRARIGTIEVVVVAPTPAERPGRGADRPRADLASRHYLRNL